MSEIVSVDPVKVFVPRTNWVHYRPLLKPGVYRLLSCDRVIYIGQSKNVGDRLRDHWVNRRTQWMFDAIQIEWCEFSDLHRLERARIKQFMPVRNKLIYRKTDPQSLPSPLEHRYKALSRPDERYIDRKDLTLSDRQFHINRLRREAESRLRHAAELEAETNELIASGALSPDAQVA